MTHIKEFIKRNMNIVTTPKLFELAEFRTFVLRVGWDDLEITLSDIKQMPSELRLLFQSTDKDPLKIWNLLELTYGYDL